MTKRQENYFKIIRAGINTTFQDIGRKNLNHIGIPIGGVMDKRNFILANAKDIICRRQPGPAGFIQTPFVKGQPDQPAFI